MHKDGMDESVKVANALADSSRMRALAALLSWTELCACHIVALLGLAPATVSRHMGLLVGSGLVTSRRQGRWVHYRVAEAFPESLRTWLDDSFRTSPQIDADRAELERILTCDPSEICACRRSGMQPTAGAANRFMEGQ
jgi:ArsR family transcriptional regulator